jgi:hypothetical protein
LDSRIIHRAETIAEYGGARGAVKDEAVEEYEPGWWAVKKSLLPYK